MLTHYQVKTCYHEQFTAMISMYVFNSLKATGNIMAAAYYEQGDVTVIWVMERWSNGALYEENRKSPAAEMVRVFTEAEGAVLKERLYMRELEWFTRDSPRKALPETDEHPLVVMLFVDVKRGMAAQFIRMNRAAIPAIQMDAGLLTFQLSQVVKYNTRFVVYKKFYNRDALQNHLKSAAIVPVIRFLQSAVKEPPFERAYHHLIEFAPLYLL
ncbi:putative quinol monooxygenase [Filimonas zeae]|nr:antibiotic biosynthesis monooxygenase [Filimonas zeae]